MATEIKTWQIVDGKLEALETRLADHGRTEAYDLESWLTSNPRVIGSSLAIIGRQVKTKSGPLDILAIDNSGNTVIIELKRDKLPREALAQAIDYTSDIAEWDANKISEICAKYTGKSLEEIIGETFPDTNFENVNVNDTQRIILVGFAIEASLERMITWLSDNYGVSINAVLLKYTMTKNGDELLTRTSIISEELEQQRISRKKFQLSMSDELGEYEEKELNGLLKRYLLQNMYSSRRMKNVLLPVCLKYGKISREQLKKEFVNYKEADSEKDAGYFISLISQQIGMSKNDFLRQVIGYEYPNHSWEKDNYHIRDGYLDIVKNVLMEVNEIEE